MNISPIRSRIFCFLCMIWLQQMWSKMKSFFSFFFILKFFISLLDLTRTGKENFLLNLKPWESYILHKDYTLHNKQSIQAFLHIIWEKSLNFLLFVLILILDESEGYLSPSFHVWAMLDEIKPLLVKVVYLLWCVC